MPYVYIVDTLEPRRLEVKVYWNLPGCGQTCFWEARMLPLVNASQRHGVRLQRWAKALQLATADLMRNVKSSSQAMARAAYPLGRQEAFEQAAQPPVAQPLAEQGPEEPESLPQEVAEPLVAAVDKGLPELAVSTELAMLLLCETTASARNRDLRVKAAQALEALLQLCLPSSQIELILHLGEGAAFGLPAHQGLVDCRAVLLQPLRAECHKRAARRLRRLHADQQQVQLVELLQDALQESPQLCRAWCSAVAAAVDTCVSSMASAHELPTDVLQARVAAVRGPRTCRRLDPVLREAIEDVARAGPQAQALMTRVHGKLFSYRKRARAELATERRLYEYLQSARQLAQNSTHVGLSMDGSRVGQDKTLITACWLADQDCSFWLPPQARRSAQQVWSCTSLHGPHDHISKQLGG